MFDEELGVELVNFGTMESIAIFVVVAVVVVVVVVSNGEVVIRVVVSVGSESTANVELSMSPVLPIDTGFGGSLTRVISILTPPLTNPMMQQTKMMCQSERFIVNFI